MIGKLLHVSTYGSTYHLPRASHSSYLFLNLHSSLGLEDWVAILTTFSVTTHTIQISLPSTGMHAAA